jgi:hypothetical protein
LSRARELLAAPLNPLFFRRTPMSMSLNRRAALGVAAAILSLSAVPSFGQAPADRPLRVILSVGPGSGVDTIMRAVQPSLSKAIGQSGALRARRNSLLAAGLIGRE